MILAGATPWVGALSQDIEVTSLKKVSYHTPHNMMAMVGVIKVESSAILEC